MNAPVHETKYGLWSSPQTSKSEPQILWSSQTYSQTWVWLAFSTIETQVSSLVSSHCSLYAHDLYGNPLYLDIVAFAPAVKNVLPAYGTSKAGFTVKLASTAFPSAPTI